MLTVHRVYSIFALENRIISYIYQKRYCSVNTDDSGSDSDSSDQAFNDNDLKRRILDASLPFVHSYGWNVDAISEGAKSLGYSSMVHNLFASGALDLVNYFYFSCHKKLEEHLQKEVNNAQENPELKKRTPAFIVDAIKYRLLLHAEYIESWPSAMALHASPFNVTTALTNIGSIVDTVWHYAGDRSVDTNWYTKRILLAAVYKSTEIFMIQDSTENYEDTWKFLSRRLSDVNAIGKCIRNGNELVKDAGTFVYASVLTAMNIIGINAFSKCL